jgi:hypothetical protein
MRVPWATRLVVAGAIAVGQAASLRATDWILERGELLRRLSGRWQDAAAIAALAFIVGVAPASAFWSVRRVSIRARAVSWRVVLWVVAANAALLAVVALVGQGQLENRLPAWLVPASLFVPASFVAAVVSTRPPKAGPPS